MRHHLKRVVDQFLTGQLNLDQVEVWLIAHLQEILDSGDALAIEIVNELDSILIVLPEGLVTLGEIEDAMRRFSSLLRTDTVEYVGAGVSSRIGTAQSAESISVSFEDRPQVIDHRVQWQFA